MNARRASVHLVLVGLASLAAARGLAAQEGGSSRVEEPPRIGATRLAENAAIRLDGILSEPEWKRAESLGGLRQSDPNEGAPASESTEVRVLFDDQRVFISVWASAENPAAINARIRERDALMEDDGSGGIRFAGDDAVALLLDATNDHRSAVVLATNPLGALFDAQITDDGRDINAEWDGVWEVRAARVAGGWSAEFAVPFSVLRPDSRTWGFNVYRVLQTRNEHALWSSWRRGGEGFARVSRAGVLEGMPTVGASVSGELQAKVYAILRDDGDATAVSGSSGTTDFGVDFKLEVRPGLVLDATLNPDFAQADVDDEHVNLTRYDLFLPEKRGFFLENSGVFSFGVRSGGEPPPFLLFHSRRLGIDESGPVRILAGGRLTGRVGAQTVGLLHVVSDPDTPVPYLATTTAARVKRDVGETGYVGAMVTRAQGSAGVSATGGLDASIWPTKELNIQGFYARSEATEATSGAAYSATVRYNAERVGFDGELTSIDPEARADLGFVPRTDVRRVRGLLRLTARPTFPGIQRIDLNLLASRYTTTTGTLTDHDLGPAVAVESKWGDRLNVYQKSGRTWIFDPFVLGGRVRVAAGSYASRLRGLVFASSPSRPLGITVFVSGERAWGGDLSSVTFAGSATVSDRLSLEPAITRSRVDLPGGAFEAWVPQVGVRLAFSNRLVASFRSQRNSLEGDGLSQLRVEYLYRPGSEIFVVLQASRGARDDFVRHDRRGIVKVTWLHRHAR